MTEIMCTLTPAQVFGKEEEVRKMCAAGMRSVRINTAHVTSTEELGRLARRLKEIDPALKVLIDTKGPEMRTTAGEINLATGEMVELEGTGTDTPTTPGHIRVNYPAIHSAVKEGDTILIDDGRIELHVTRMEGSTIHAKVIRGGKLGSRKGLAVKDIDIDLPAVSEHDREYIAYASQSPDIDIIAHSFVRSADDVLAVKAAMKAPGKKVIAKIENQQGLDNLNAISAVADGLLIARGDLTASIGKENIPAAQARIAAAAKKVGKPLYLATNILPSLMLGKKVSEEDVKGVETALAQGVDVMLLTNETASGPRPLESVRVLESLISQKPAKKLPDAGRTVLTTMLKWLLLCVAGGFLLRILLIFHPITVASSLEFWQWPALFVIGAVNDICIGVVMGLPLMLFFMSSGHWRFKSPARYVCLGLLAALFLWLSFGCAELREFNRGLARILRWLSLFWLLSFAARAFLPRIRKGWMRVWTALFLFVYLAVFVMNMVGEWFFWNEFGVRYNFIAVDYLVYTNEVVGNIMQSYSMGWIITAVVLVTAALEWALFRHTVKASSGFHTPGWRVKIGGGWILASIIALPVLALTEKGAHTTNAWYNGLQANGAYSFALAFTNNELDYDEFYYICPADEATRVREALAAECVPACAADTILTPNIILVTMESMSGDYMRRFGGSGELTPAMDSLWSQSLAFDRMLAAGNRTVRGLEALLLSRPPSPGESIIKREANSGYPSIADRLKDLGYRLCFYYGGNSYFDNMEDFYTDLGFEIHDRKTMSDDDVSCATVWGVCDGDMYTRLLDEMDTMTTQGAPVFAHILTTSNHRPYIYPDGCVSISPESQSREGAVMYSDYALGQFLKEAARRPWFNNTVFVVSADHCASSAGSTEIPLENYHIPAFIYAPALVQPRVVDGLVSQIDLLPTLFGILGWEADTALYGRDVNAPGYRSRAFVATYQDLGFFRDDTLTVLSPGRNFRQYVLAPTAENPLATRAVEVPSMRHVNTAAVIYSDSDRKPTNE